MLNQGIDQQRQAFAHTHAYAFLNYACHAMHVGWTALQAHSFHAHLCACVFGMYAIQNAIV